MYVRDLGHPLPLQIIGPKTAYFRRLRNLTATLRCLSFPLWEEIFSNDASLAGRSAARREKSGADLLSLSQQQQQQLRVTPDVKRRLRWIVSATDGNVHRLAPALTSDRLGDSAGKKSDSIPRRHNKVCGAYTDPLNA